MISRGGFSSAGGQRGMTLIEVLVTVVLISVGLLGVAALQLTSLKGNKEAYIRSQASVLAGDILDRVRANQAGFRNGEYVAAFNATGTAGTIAGQDLAAWQAAINRTLPGGDDVAAGRIERTVVDAQTQIVTVTVRWSERTDDATFRASGATVDTPTFRIRSEI